MSVATSLPPSPGPPLLHVARRAIANRFVQVTLVGWVALNAFGAIFFRSSNAIDRPLLEGQPLLEQMAAANLAMFEVLLLIGIVVWLTRNRADPLPVLLSGTGREARRETLVLVTWGVVAVFGGIALGQAMGTSSLGFHLAGTLFGAHDHDLVTRPVALSWAAYNVVAYVVIPMLWLRLQRDTMTIPLRSLDRRQDALLILVVLGIESAMQLSTVSDALFGLGTRQVLIGVPATFALYLVGTVLPTVIFVQALLVPRYLALTRSVPVTVVLGGLTYTAVHVSDSWMVAAPAGNAFLSLVFLVLTYFGPGMLKTVMTVRTGNAWVHAWAYHAFAPHTLIDTPLIVRIFRI